MRVTQREWVWPQDPMRELADVALADDEVAVWHASADRARPDAGAVLAAHEHERMRRYRRPEDQALYLAAHGLLRVLLGHLLGADPADVEFRAGPHGKPDLAAPTPAGAPMFNLSHSAGMVAVALCRTAHVGVDVEGLGRARNWELVAPRVLTPSERRSLDAIPQNDRQVAFLRLWTRKEASVKAAGTGILDDLHLREVPLPGGALWDLLLPAGHVGAVAIQAVS